MVPVPKRTAKQTTGKGRGKGKEVSNEPETSLEKKSKAMNQKERAELMASLNSIDFSVGLC